MSASMRGATRPAPDTRRKFTDSFKIGQRVRVIRTEHGWFDGQLEAVICRMGDYWCVVREIQGGKPTRTEHEIRKPRDIWPA
jgi:hypothetical protein